MSGNEAAGAVGAASDARLTSENAAPVASATADAVAVVPGAAAAEGTAAGPAAVASAAGTPQGQDDGDRPEEKPSTRPAEPVEPAEPARGGPDGAPAAGNVPGTAGGNEAKVTPPTSDGDASPDADADSDAGADDPRHAEDCPHTDPVARDEPLLPARVHRPVDLMSFLFGVLGIALVLGIAGFAHATTSGVEQDIAQGATHAPEPLITIAGLLATVAVLIVPVAFAVERLIKRDGLRIADGVLAAVLAHGVSLATDLWVSDAAPAAIRDALTRDAPGGGLTDPVHGYLAPVIAYMTAVGMARRPRWRVALWSVLFLDSFAVLMGGYTTPFSIVVTVLIGWTVAYGTLYGVGSPNVRPTGQNLLAGLRRVGFAPQTAVRAEDEFPDSPESERGRRYLVTLEDGPLLDVTVVDREQQAHGFFYRMWRRLQLRGITQRRSLQSLRQALEQEALLAYAAISAGANAPRLIATSELGPDAVMLVYEHMGGRSLDALPDAEITDGLLRGAWEQVRSLQSRRIAHRRLVGESLQMDRSGKVFLTDLRGGEIAAGDLVLRMDVAQLLTTLALRVGPERSVASAVAVLGPDAVADSLPLLQPIALSRTTRATLKQLARERAQRERDAVLAASRARRMATGEAGAESDQADQAGRAKETAKETKAARRAEKKALEDALEEAREEDLLTRIRHQVLLIRPQAPVEPVRLERVRPRTLVSIIAGAFAAYFLLSQISSIDPATLLAEANWGWIIVAVLASAASYVAAAMALSGFVPEKLSFLRTTLAQIAGSFVKLVAPAAIGGVALNTRYLQKSGVRPGLAVASVGASQLIGLGSHIMLLAVFGYITGTEKTPSLSPSRTVMAGVLTVGVLFLIVTAVPSLRRFASTRIRALFAGVVPRMLDVLQQPLKLTTGIGGTLLLTLFFVLCLDASVRTFHGEVNFAAVAVIFLAGNALGSAAPTPGGLGAVEGALIAGLTTIGRLDSATATSAVLLFRVLTFWLPVLPGWLAFTQLTRRQAL
ncbi:lysylphosphatidylglycerol synthase domain-containing protein [Streptomyces sp. NPDC046977]|uniref:lysylphosphatidylglycerol synthase domain-containing protein n=1 Tax=Streptomyces sp. NPDC046977 TaxID=3154703 RepID=UPI0033F4042B